MSRADEDWYSVLACVAEGDRLAFVELSQLVTRFLHRLRAYDFEDEWSDLVQNVVWALVRAHREDRIRDRQATLAYIGEVTRRQFLGRLRQVQRHHERDRKELDDGDEPATDALTLRVSGIDVAHLDLRRALEGLREPHRSLVAAVYGESKTYQEAARELDVPFGSAKRYLAAGLKELRARLSEAGPDGGVGDDG